MKKAAAAVIPLLLALGAFLLFRSAQHGTAGHEDADKEKPAETNAPPAAAGGVTLGAESQQRAGLVAQAIAPESLSGSVRGFGTVLDPSSLALLDNELSDAETAVKLSEAQAARTRTLFEQNQSVAQKALETAEAQVRTDHIRLLAARRKLELEWGSATAALDSTNRLQLVNRLLRREIVLARVEVLVGDSFEGNPTGAKITTLAAQRALNAALFSEATTVDPRTQGRGFILQVDSPPPGLRPGTAIDARLTTAGPERKGWQIPSSAVVRHLGHPWIYLQKGPEQFSRTAVELNELAGDHWFTTTEFDTKDRIVVTGAQVLLSEELKSQLAPGD